MERFAALYKSARPLRWLSVMGIRCDVQALCGQRVRAPRVENGLISCSWFHLLRHGASTKPEAICSVLNKS